MKRLLSLGLVLILFVAFVYAEQEQQVGVAIIQFAETEHRFGLIAEEDGPFDHTFEFTNVGDAPLIIANVRGTCTCAPPVYWTRTPVMPGESGVVTLRYITDGRPGIFRRPTRVISNATESTVTLTMSGEVIPRQQ